MKKRILEKLEETEKKYGVEILFAVESGSRAWGFASPDSDYDVRFVYKHPQDWYLNIWEQKDTIQFMTEDDLDGSGWDIRKMLRLLGKSNASLLGWIASDIVYKSKEGFKEELESLAAVCFHPLAVFHHYHAMNKGFLDQVNEGSVTIKGFFYALRTALCANWVLKKNTITPDYFKKLYPLLEEKYHSKLDDLIEAKANLKEMQCIEIPDELIVLAQHIVMENEAGKHSLKGNSANGAILNQFFLKHI